MMHRMKQLAAFLFLLATTASAFPVHTNSFAGRAADSVPPTFDAVLWDWSGMDDQVVIADFSDVTFSNAGLRLCYPVRGQVYLEMSVAGGQLTIVQTNLTTIRTESFTNCYARIPPSTNYWPAWSNQTITTTINELGVTGLSLSVSASFAGSNMVGAAATDPACVVYVASNAMMLVPDYGSYTTRYFGATSLLTRTTSQVQTLNIVSNHNFAYGATNWTTNLFYMQSGVAACGNDGVSTGYMSQYLPDLTSGGVYRLFVNGWLMHVGGLTTGNLFASVGSYTSPVVTAVANNPLQVDQVFTQAVNGGTLKISAYGQTGCATRISYVQVDPVSVTRSSASMIITNITLASNVVRVVSPAYTRVNSGYSSNTVAYQRIMAAIARTNIPPDGLYYSELLAYENTTNQARSLLKGQVTVSHSLYANTNQATWVSPALGSTLLNGINGAAQIIGGTGISVGTAGTNITITATGSATATNGADLSTLSNSVLGAWATASNAYTLATTASNLAAAAYPGSNPSGYQTAAQVSESLGSFGSNATVGTFPGIDFGATQAIAKVGPSTVTSSYDTATRTLAWSNAVAAGGGSGTFTQAQFGVTAYTNHFSLQIAGFGPWQPSLVPGAGNTNTLTFHPSPSPSDIGAVTQDSYQGNSVLLVLGAGATATITRANSAFGLYHNATCNFTIVYGSDFLAAGESYVALSVSNGPYSVSMLTNQIDNWSAISLSPSVRNHIIYHLDYGTGALWHARQ